MYWQPLIFVAYLATMPLVFLAFAAIEIKMHPDKYKD
jgi:hypothetical protein